LFILDNEGDEGTGSAGLEFGVVTVLFNFQGAGVLSVDQAQKVFNVGGLFRLK
jgi:hypothetical protein